MSAPASSAVDWHESIADSFAAGYQRSPRFRERLAVWRALIGAHVHAGDRVLDAGCGAGTFSFEAAARGADVEAIDGSPAMIALCKQRQSETGIANIRFETAMLDSLGERDAESFDVVLSSSVLEYLPDLAGEARALARLLKPGGRLILSMPNADSFYRKFERVLFRTSGRPRYFAHVCSMASASELAALYRDLGLEPVETRFYADPPGPFRLFGARRGSTLVVAVGRKSL